jgi:hypothetical protein
VHNSYLHTMKVLFPWGGVLEVIIPSHLPKKMSTVYGISMFITMFKEVHHIHPTHILIPYLRSIIIIISYLCLGLQHTSFHSGFWNKIVYSFLWRYIINPDARQCGCFWSSLSFLRAVKFHHCSIWWASRCWNTCDRSLNTWRPV